MYNSAEIRWYGIGNVPESLQNYLNLNEVKIESEKSRTDWYFIKKDSSLSIKLREGNIEIKQLVKNLGEFSFNPGISGYIEHWIKFSFSICKEDKNFFEIENKNTKLWIPVIKKRSLAKYEIIGNSTINQVLIDSRPVEGCILELSILELNNKAWWSLCYEAFGLESNVQESLLMTINHVFKLKGNLPFLTLLNSKSYPVWLGSQQNN